MMSPRWLAAVLLLAFAAGFAVASPGGPAAGGQNCTGTAKGSVEGFAPLETSGEATFNQDGAYVCYTLAVSPQDGFHGVLTATLSDTQGGHAFIAVDCSLAYVPLPVEQPPLNDLLGCQPIGQAAGALQPGTWTLDGSADGDSNLPVAVGNWQVSVSVLDP